MRLPLEYLQNHNMCAFFVRRQEANSRRLPAGGYKSGGASVHCRSIVQSISFRDYPDLEQLVGIHCVVVMGVYDLETDPQGRERGPRMPRRYGSRLAGFWNHMMIVAPFYDEYHRE